MTEDTKTLTPEEAWAAFDAAVVVAGHTLIVDEDGEVDHFVCSGGYCNGPGCSVCGDNWCHHCRPAINPCDGGKWKAAYEAKKRVEAAGPDLLEAAKAAQAALAMLTDPEIINATTTGDAWRTAVAAEAKARAAISKAEGLQSPEGGDRG